MAAREKIEPTGKRKREKEADDSFQEMEENEKICKDIMVNWGLKTQKGKVREYDLSGRTVQPKGEGKTKIPHRGGIHETDISSLSLRITFLSNDLQNFKNTIQAALEKIPEAVTPIVIEKLAELQSEVHVPTQVYKDSLSTAILISGFATVVSAALSSYLFSIGSLAGIAFFYPTIIGLGTILFLLYKNYRRGHIK